MLCLHVDWLVGDDPGHRFLDSGKCDCFLIKLSVVSCLYLASWLGEVEVEGTKEERETEVREVEEPG